MKVPDLNPHLQMSFLTYNGRIITLPCKVRENGNIECEPFTENTTIIDYQLKEKVMNNKEVPLFMQRNQPKEQNTKASIIPDQDVVLVKEFITSLDKVAEEMELLDEDEYSGNVLSVKLKRVYDEYRDRVMPSSTFESFIDYYSYLQSKKEEEREEIAHKEYISKLESIKKDNETKLNELYKQYKEVLGLTLEEVRKQYKVI